MRKYKVLLFIIVFISFIGFSQLIKNPTSGVTFGKLNTHASEETMQFCQLVGAWDITFFSKTNDAKWIESKAKWIL